MPTQIQFENTHSTELAKVAVLSLVSTIFELLAELEAKTVVIYFGLKERSR